MRRVGVREFKANATRYIREVHESGESIVVTVNGRPMATLSGYERRDDEADRAAAQEAALDRMLALAAELQEDLETGTSLVEAISQQRR